MNWQERITDFLNDQYGITLNDTDTEEIKRIILEEHEGHIFRSEMKKVRETRIECAIAAKQCIEDNYPFPNGEVAGEMIEHAIINQSRTPNLTDSVRYLLTY